MLPRIYRSESEIRKRQIDTLKIFNDNVTEVIEGSEYSVAFQSGKNELTLQVLLSNEFPNEKPTLKVSPCILHPWVNSEGEVISAPGLLNFTVHSDLGRVVQAIIREFERTPPPLGINHTHIINSSPNSIQYCTGINHINVSSPHYSYSNINALVPSTSSTSQSLLFPELNSLNLEELKTLSDNIDKQDEFIENLPQTKELNKTLDDLLIRIEELTNSNLSKKSELERLHEERKQRIEILNKLLQDNEVLTENYQLLSDKYKPANIKEMLRLAAAKADEQSENIAESFLNGDLDVDQFISSYMKARIVSHTRKAKEEKLSHQLNELERAGF